MSFRKLLVAVAAMVLATTVFADDATTSTGSTDTTTQQAAPADQSATSSDQSAAPAAAATTTADNSAAAAGDKIDLNKATVKELMKVKGMGAARAKAIVMYRKKHGDFKSTDDLKEVKGFKKLNDKKMNELVNQLTVS